MGTHAPGFRRVTHHDVVNAPIREEAERVPERSHRRHPFVDVLYQQGPVGVGQGGEVVLPERAVADLPGPGTRMFQYQTRFHLVLAGEPREFPGTQGTPESGQGIPDQ